MWPYSLVCKYVERAEHVSNIDLKSPIHSDACVAKGVDLAAVCTRAYSVRKQLIAKKNTFLLCLRTS